MSRELPCCLKANLLMHSGHLKLLLPLSSFFFVILVTLIVYFHAHTVLHCFTGTIALRNKRSRARRLLAQKGREVGGVSDPAMPPATCHPLIMIFRGGTFPQGKVVTLAIALRKKESRVGRICKDSLYWCGKKRL